MSGFKKQKTENAVRKNGILGIFRRISSTDDEAEDMTRANDVENAEVLSEAQVDKASETPVEKKSVEATVGDVVQVNAPTSEDNAKAAESAAVQVNAPASEGSAEANASNAAQSNAPAKEGKRRFSFKPFGKDKREQKAPEEDAKGQPQKTDTCAKKPTSGAQNEHATAKNAAPVSQDAQAAKEREENRRAIEEYERQRIKQVADAEVIGKELKREKRKESTLSVLSLIWTLLSTVFAIASTCVYIGRRWVDTTLTYVLIAALALYVGIFIGFIVVAFQNPKQGKRDAKNYKKLISIFKSFVSLSFLVLSAIDMAALAMSDVGLVRWLMFGISFVVALVQLVLRIWLFIVGLIRRRLSKMYTVKIKNFVDGKLKRRSVADIYKEHSYNK